MADALEISVTPLSPACGAEIGGVDLTKPLSPSVVEAIKQAWGKYLVLVFRGQTITQEQQLRFASYFGELGNRKKAPEPLRARTEGIYQDNEKVLLVSNIKIDGQPIGAFGEGEFWFHIDSGYTPRPYKYTFLFALELPSSGGNTLFSNMYRAYEAVPLALKDRLAGKRALHIHEYNRAQQASGTASTSGPNLQYYVVREPQDRSKLAPAVKPRIPAYSRRPVTAGRPMLVSEPFWRPLRMPSSAENSLAFRGDVT